MIVSQGFRLLGILDVKNTPCARDAILHGAGGSLAIGLLHFLSTSESYSPEMFICASKTCVVVLWVSVSSNWSLEMSVLPAGRVRRSFDVGFAGFILTTLGSW